MANCMANQNTAFVMMRTLENEDASARHSDCETFRQMSLYNCSKREPGPADSKTREIRRTFCETHGFLVKDHPPRLLPNLASTLRGRGTARRVKCLLINKHLSVAKICKEYY